MPDIFISYNSRDEAFAQKLYDQLTSAKFDVWFAKAHIPPGANWRRELDKARSSAHVVLPVLTPRWKESPWTVYETYHIKHTIPLVCEGELIDIAPEPLRDWQAIDLRNANQAVWQSLFGHLKAHLTKIKPEIARHTVFRVLPEENENFTGREELLENIAKSLYTGETVTITQATHRSGRPQNVAVSGMGGVGKTQLAAEFAYRHEGDYEIVWWLRSEDTETLASDYALLATALNLPEAQSQRREDAVEAARSYLSQHSNWLIVFDNAQSVHDIAPHLPGGNGHVLITTRSPHHDRHAKVIAVDTWPRADSIAFLEKRLDRQDPDFDALAADLGDLPLALEQAAAYMDQVGLTAGVYRQRFRKNKLAAFPNSPPEDYPSTVATTWSLAFDEIAKTPLAAELLYLFSFLAPDDIPFDLLAQWPAANDEIARDEAIAALRSYSLISVGPDNVTVHRLVQLAVRESLPPEAAKIPLELAVSLIGANHPIEVMTDVTTWPRCERLLPHGLTVLEFLGERTDLAPEAASFLADRMATYLRVRAEFARAKELFEQALRIGESAYGTNHPIVATRVNNLGGALVELGDLAGAKSAYERALRIGEAVNESDGPSIAVRFNNLGSVLHKMGDLMGAKAAFERAISIDEATCGSNDPSVATDISNLGLVLLDQGDLAGAKDAFERSLRIDEASYAENHPNIARDINNLAGVLQEIGDLDGAKAAFERALKIYEIVYGPNHPDVAICASNLGGMLRSSGDLIGAIETYERALIIDEAIYGAHHPAIARDLNNIGSVLNDLGDIIGARIAQSRAYDILRRFLGEDHPNTKLVKENLDSLPPAD